MQSLKKIAGAIISFAEFLMRMFRLADDDYRPLGKFIAGIFSIVLFSSLAYHSVITIWLTASTGGAVLFEGDPISLLLPITMLAIFFLGIIWAYWRDGPEPPQHKDLRKTDE